MGVRKGNKLTEVGEIPEDWISASLKELASKKNNAIVGGPFGSDLTAKDYTTVGIPVIRGQNMARKYVSGDSVFVSEGKAKDLYANTATNNDLVFTQRGTLGQVSIVPPGGKKTYLISQSQMKITLDEEKANSCYVYYYFLSTYGQKQITSSAIQTGVPHTNLGILKQYLVPLPVSIIEQSAIADALGDADDLIDSLEGLIEKKRLIKRGAMEELLTGKRRLPGFAEPWHSYSLNEVSVKIQDGTHFSPKSGGRDFLYITSRNIKQGRLDISSAEYISTEEHEKIYSRCDTNTNDLLLTKDGANTGNAAINILTEPFSLLSSVAAIRCDSTKADPFFLLQIILSSIGKKAIADLLSGNAITRLTLVKIRHLTFLFPLVEEQSAIAQVLSDMDAEIEALEAKLEKARAIKRGMMEELLSGRIRLV